MLGDIDTSGSLNAQIIHQFTKQIRGKFIAQVGCIYSITGIKWSDGTTLCSSNMLSSKV